jgi:hypothetical protein
VTVADCETLPPAPEQFSVNVPVLVNTPVDWLPLVPLAPDHAPEAVQLLAAVDDQVSVELAPLAMVCGVAVIVIVGTAATVTVADWKALPPVPVQLNENVPVLASAPVDCEPLVALVPDHAPDAVQVSALVDDQVSVEDPPLATEVGFAASDTVGAGGGGGVPETATVAEALVIPPAPVQIRE